MFVYKIFIFLLGVCLSSAAEDEEFTNFDPLENPDLLEGDILGSTDNRNAIVDNKYRWPGGIVPYVLDKGLSSTVSIALVRSAMQDYEAKTCIRFVPRTTQENYVNIFSGQGCNSYVGMYKGKQPLSLGKGCGYRGTILHELGHAIGFHHEHNRSDRDGYVTIHWENVMAGKESNFGKRKPNENRLITPFDYDSIMLYGSHSFSKDKAKLRTISRKDGNIIKSITQKKKMSASDILRVNKLYEC